MNPTRMSTGGHLPPRTGRRSTGNRTASHGPDLARAVDLVLELMAIPGPSGQEQAVAECLVARLNAAGAAAAWWHVDSAHRRIPRGGQTGNLILRLPGTCRAPRRLLTAHLDTVPICVGSQPVRKGDLVHSANPETGLGADDRAGVAVLLVTALEILERRLPHPPLTFCWFVQEEVGLLGSRHVSQGKLGRPGMAFNWDGGAPQKLTVGATGGYRMTLNVRGLASHAGGAPEWGISAIVISALAITDLQARGWHGRVQRGTHYGTANIGVIEGGQATNVVTDRVVLRAEARSHDPEFRRRIARELERAFQRAARKVRNVTGQCGHVECEGRLDYEAFRLRDDEPAVLLAERVLRARGLEPERAVTNGGLDANWLTAHGIPTVTLGCGQLNQHMVAEALDLVGFQQACGIALDLATQPAAESSG